MSRRVKFYDLMLAEADDFNHVGEYAQGDLDDVVRDAVSTDRSFAGFEVSILPGGTSIQVAAGRFYSGMMFRLDTVTEKNLANQIPLVQKRIAVVTVWGQEVATDLQQRSVAVDVDDMIGEPQALQMLMLRQANVETIVGAESGDPQPPAIPTNSIVVATIVLGVGGIESVTMNDAARLTSTQRNAQAIGALRADFTRVEPAVTGLVSDLAALNDRSRDRASRKDLERGLLDIARLKDKVGLPDTYAQYGATFFADDAETDTVYSASTAKIDNGLLFPDAAASDWPLALFNDNDPNAKKHASGQVLPAYDNVVAIAGPDTNGDVSLSQFEVKTHTIRTETVYRTVTRYGWTWNYAPYWYGYYYPYAYAYAYDWWTWGGYWGWWEYYPVKTYYSWTETIPEQVTSVVTTTTAYNGILTAETFRAPRAMWFTGVNLKLTSLDTSGDVHVFLTETELGQPVLARTLSSVSIPVANLKKSPVKTAAMMNPVLLESGRMYAIVIITQGNHRIATVHPDNWRDGTWFAGTDGEYFVGDLTKDIYLEVLAAEFRKPRNEIVLQTADLAGGINDIVIATEQIVPSGTEISWEINIAGTWRPLRSLETMPGGTNTAPMRAVLIGSKDLMPAFYTGANRLTLSRPALALSEQSSEITLGAGAENIRLEYVVHKWNAVDATLAPTIREGSNVHTPDVTEPPVADDPSGDSVRLGFVFNLGAPITTFRIRTDMTRTAGIAPPVVLERRYVALS